MQDGLTRTSSVRTYEKGYYTVGGPSFNAGRRGAQGDRRSGGSGAGEAIGSGRCNRRI